MNRLNKVKFLINNLEGKGYTVSIEDDILSIGKNDIVGLVYGLLSENITLKRTLSKREVEEVFKIIDSYTKVEITEPEVLTIFDLYADTDKNIYFEESREVLKRLVERNIPKEPIYVNEQYSTCPNCKEEAFFDDEYCRKCGQSLWW